MKKVLYFIISFLALTSFASARESVDVISRYSPATAVSQIMFQIIKKLNETQDKYSFRYVHVPGANGESAAVTSLEQAKSGKKILWFGAISTFTLSAEDKNIVAIRTWDMSDFTFISGVSTSNFAVLVDPKSGITSVQELIERLNKRDKVFSGNTISTNSSPFLFKLFVEHYNLSHKATFIEYKNIGDVVRATLGGELDFVIHNIADMQTLRPILMANRERIAIMPDVPAAAEVQFDNFYISTVSALAVPGGNKELVKDVSALVAKLCKDKEIEADMHKRLYVSKLCLPQEGIVNLINEEKNRLK
jgi:tripartite-type tricarboxylate transporter receptor subunit TctC